MFMHGVISDNKEIIRNFRLHFSIHNEFLYININKIDAHFNVLFHLSIWLTCLGTVERECSRSLSLSTLRRWWSHGMNKKAAFCLRGWIFLIQSLYALVKIPNDSQMPKKASTRRLGIKKNISFQLCIQLGIPINRRWKRRPKRKIYILPIPFLNAFPYFFLSIWTRIWHSVEWWMAMCVSQPVVRDSLWPKKRSFNFSFVQCEL